MRKSGNLGDFGTTYCHFSKKDHAMCYKGVTSETHQA